MNKKVKIGVFIVIGILILLFSIDKFDKKKKDITIMLDPGHGGAEENLKGAIIVSGGREVELNNSLTLLVSKYLEEEGYDVQYTRNPNREDENVSLSQRSEKANSQNCDLFISIHHDAIKDPSIKGFSIYYSSYRSNIDEDGIYLIYQNKEYKFLKEEIVGGRTHVYYEDNDEIKKLISGEDHYKIRDRSPHQVVDKSREFAGILYDELEKLNYIKPLHGAKERAIIDNDLRITRTTNMPSILFEAGFVSNEEEAIQISKKENQEKFARKVVAAINEYFKKQ